MMDKTSIISTKQLSIGYASGSGKPKTVRHDVSLNLYTGELTALIGRNGTGKSTLLRTLSGSQKPLSGSVFLNGRNLSECSEKWLSKTVGIVLTDKIMAGGLNVFDLVSLGRQPHTGFFGILNSEDRKKIDSALDVVGIYNKRNSFVSELSDGERQKVMIAKAIVQECPILLLDEPTAFLDVASRLEIISLLREIAVSQNKAVLFSTHEIGQALVLSDRLWLMCDDGSILSGQCEDMILGGYLDNVFNSDKVSFDREHGLYYPLLKWKTEVRVSAGDETLLHWTINALNRFGCACKISCDDESLPLVNTISYNNIKIVTTSTEFTCISFDELSKKILYLQKIFK